MSNENSPKGEEELRAFDLAKNKIDEKAKKYKDEEKDIKKRASEKEKKHRTWFTAIFAAFIIVDLFAFAHYQGLAALTLGIIQLIFLIFVGYVLEVKQIPILLTKFIKGISKR